MGTKPLIFEGVKRRNKTYIDERVNTLKFRNSGLAVWKGRLANTYMSKFFAPARDVLHSHLLARKRQEFLIFEDGWAAQIDHIP
jgi:hypothetical protein